MVWKTASNYRSLLVILFKEEDNLKWRKLTQDTTAPIADVIQNRECLICLITCSKVLKLLEWTSDIYNFIGERFQWILLVCKR